MAEASSKSRDRFPDADVPDGLTEDDLSRAARLVLAWENEGEWSALGATAAIYRMLRTAEEKNRRAAEDAMVTR